MSCIHAFVLQCDCNLHHRVRTLGCCLRSILRPSDGCIGRYLMCLAVAMSAQVNLLDDWLRRESFVFLDSSQQVRVAIILSGSSSQEGVPGNPTHNIGQYVPLPSSRYHATRVTRNRSRYPYQGYDDATLPCSPTRSQHGCYKCTIKVTKLSYDTKGKRQPPM